ncbi:RXT2-like protein [Rhizophagus irregularis DAOM 181602=DAOM 197198]|nr:RXT2-like protein [Rhizophagus irregularis DAOM 181602=DAOM 197198]
MKEHNGTTSASAPTPSGRRQSIAPQQPAIIPQGSLQMRPNFQTLTHPQTSLQQTNINHTGLMIQRPIAPGMQQVGPAGVPTFQNVSGQQLPISPNSRVPGIRQSPQAPFYSSPMYPLVDQTSNYRSVPGTNASVRPPSMSPGRMSLPPQSGHQSSSMQPHPSPRLSSSHSDLQSASARTTRPQLANPMVVHDTRPSSTSTLTQGLTQGVQQLSLRSSIQETPSKMTSIPHASLRPTEGQRSMQESGPQAMQGIQPISHTSSRTSSQSYVSDAPPPLISQSVQLANNIRNNPKLLPQHAPIQPAQRINNQKPSSPIISQASIKTTQASPKPMHSSTKPSHRSHKNGHHNSQKSIHQSTQLTASQQASQRAEITEAAQVLYLSSMSVRSREDPRIRYMNAELNSQYAAMNNTHTNPGEGSHYIHHRNRYAGPVSLDNSMTRGMNDESISREQDIGLVPHNRGHKMKHRAEALDSGVKLRAPYGYVEDKEEIEIPNGTRRPIIYRGSKEATDQATEFVGEANDSPYKDIDVENILGPLEKPEDAVRKPHYRRILKSKHLESLAKELMERIEKEHEFNKKISRLMIVLQGDDDMHQELDFRLNPPPETVSTRVFKAEEVEGGKNFGVLNVGLQGNDRSKGKRAQEAKDQGLENLIMVREQLQEQLENSNEILRRYNETREGVLKAIRQRNMIYRRLCEIDKQRRKEEKNSDKTSTPLKKHLLKDKEKEREKEKEKEREV